jgi:hypothetical protein
LAGETAANDIDAASPRVAVKCGDVVPDWEPWQDSVALPLEQDFSWILFDFNSTYCGMSEKLAAEDSSPCSSK